MILGVDGRCIWGGETDEGMSLCGISRLTSTKLPLG